MLTSFIVPIVKNYVPNVIRHGAQLAAGSLVTSGLIQGTQQEIVTGAIIAVAAGVWSWAEKKGLLNKLFA